MFDKTCIFLLILSNSMLPLSCVCITVNLSRGRAVTNVGRTCGPTPLPVLLVIFSCNKICLYYKSIRSCKNWVYRAKAQFNEFGLSQFGNISNPVSESFPDSVSDKMMEKFVADWSFMLNTDSSRRGNYSKRNLKWKSIVK